MNHAEMRLLELRGGQAPGQPDHLGHTRLRFDGNLSQEEVRMLLEGSASGPFVPVYSTIGKAK